MSLWLRLSQLSRHRATGEHSAPNERRGDSDLVPVAIILWIGSVMRVGAGAVGGEVFGTEATLAFLCVVVIPCWLLWSWVQAEKPTLDPHEPARSEPTQTSQK